MAFVKDGNPILTLDFNKSKDKKYSFSDNLSEIQAFCEIFSKNSGLNIDIGDINITYEEGDNISIFIMSSCATKNLHTRAKLLLNAFEFEYKDILQKEDQNLPSINEFKQSAKEFILET